jgi:hypothetical protein
MRAQAGYDSHRLSSVPIPQLSQHERRVAVGSDSRVLIVDRPLLRSLITSSDGCTRLTFALKNPRSFMDACHLCKQKTQTLNGTGYELLGWVEGTPMMTRRSEQVVCVLRAVSIRDGQRSLLHTDIQTMRQGIVERRLTCIGRACFCL